MLGDISGVENIYIVCGYTDMRKAIDGLCAVVEEVVKRDPRENSLFLFCGKRCDRIKALMYDGSGFVLIYKEAAKSSCRQYCYIQETACYVWLYL